MTATTQALPPPPPAAAPPPPPPPATAPLTSRTATKLQLLEKVAGLDRGALATLLDKAVIEQLVSQLEAAPPSSTQPPLSGSPAAIEGRWQLLYANTQAFRSSPFFLAFEGGVVRDTQLAEAIFAFTDAIPGAEIGAAYQTVSLAGGRLISEVDMVVFPGLRGTVVTSSRLQPQPPDTLLLEVESTRVTGSSFSPLLDSVSVPVEQLVQRLGGSTAATYVITYVDDTLRVTRTPGGQLMLHRRVG